ncbi:hypothetical protein HZH66_015501 [Vespula vulgaris]|uniref:Uncharacterized protein n=1 Tax=Vespula vulgaris TaxID=7454 RepID=A0A834IXU0_VESVU|nr:hypothetical protein HZH66_015501 [Vespula vulgaris]
MASGCSVSMKTTENCQAAQFADGRIISVKNENRNQGNSWIPKIIVGIRIRVRVRGLWSELDELESKLELELELKL